MNPQSETGDPPSCLSDKQVGSGNSDGQCALGWLIPTASQACGSHCGSFQIPKHSSPRCPERQTSQRRVRQKCTHNTVFFLLRYRYFMLLPLFVTPIILFRQYLVDNGSNPMSPRVHRPLELRHSIVTNHFPKVTFRLQRKAANRTNGADACACTLGYRVRSMVYVGDML